MATIPLMPPTPRAAFNERAAAAAAGALTADAACLGVHWNYNVDAIAAQVRRRARGGASAFGADSKRFLLRLRRALACTGRRGGRSARVPCARRRCVLGCVGVCV